MMMQFYRLGCGCIVLLSQDGTKARDIERCDTDWYDRSIGISKWKDVPTYPPHVFEGQPLTAEEEERIVGRLRNLIDHGYRFNEIKTALTIHHEKEEQQ